MYFEEIFDRNCLWHIWSDLKKNLDDIIKMLLNTICVCCTSIVLIVERVVPKTMENTRVLKASWTTQCFSSFLPYLMITRSKFIGHQLLMWRDKDYHSLKEVVRPHQIITAKLSESKTFPMIFILFLFFFFLKGKWSTFSPPQIIKSFWKSIKNNYLYR